MLPVVFDSIKQYIDIDVLIRSMDGQQILSSETAINKTILPNGLRIVTEHVPYVRSVSIGLWIGVGSRDEPEHQRGISHFIEHMLFKGTQTRSAVQIADEIESLGGQLNAFTEKENTCIYIKALSEFTSQALDILADMLLCSLFDPEEIDKELNVVSEEIKRYLDDPEDYVHDLLPEIAWQGHVLAGSTIGTADTVLALTRDNLSEYMNQYYRPDAILISVAGNVSHSFVVDFIAERFSNLNGKRPKRNGVPIKFNTANKTLKKSTEQVHFCLGTPGYNLNEDKKHALSVLDFALGGGMSSRLFQKIREQQALAYSIGSYMASYSDIGMFVVYGGVAAEKLDDTLQIIEREFADIAKNAISLKELERARNCVRASSVMGQENMTRRMNRIARSELYHGRLYSLQEVIKKVLAVTQDDVAQVASELLLPENRAFVAIGNI